jgi:hypothetical protein
MFFISIQQWIEMRDKMASRSHASLLNSQQILIRRGIKDKAPFKQIKPLLLQQHARLHAQVMSGRDDWSYQDEILGDIPQEWMRVVPDGQEHSIAWLLWHLTRCEDITMNLLVMETEQIFLAEGWYNRLNIPWRDTGNAMTPSEINIFSQQIGLDALLTYRIVVGRQTQAIIKALQQESIYRKMDPTAVQRITDEGAVLEEAKWLIDYWSKRDVAGLLLMPATRHILVI